MKMRLLYIICTIEKIIKLYDNKLKFEFKIKKF